MKKTFDTVNLKILEKAMRRIRLSDNIIALTVGLFKNRKMRVYMKMETLGFIKGMDNIDQGEIISPLVWRIFYDPLLTIISRKTELGFTMGYE